MSTTPFLPPLRAPPPSFLIGLVVGAVGYLLSRHLSPILTSRLGSRSFNQKVASLDTERLYHYHSLLPSSVHAIVQIVGTFAFVFYGREGYDDVLAEGASPAVVFDERAIVPYGVTRIGPTVYMGVFVGYLLADIGAAPSMKGMGYPYVVHHVAASLCWTFCASNRIMQGVASLLQFNELSTPLLNIRQYLLTAGYQSSDPELVASSMVFFATFGMVRVAPLPFAIRNWVVRDFDAVGKQCGMGSAILLSMFFAINALLQLSWFLIMCRKVASAVTKRPKEKKQ